MLSFLVRVASKRSISLRRVYGGVALARKLARYCWPGDGLRYPLGSGRRLSSADPVGSIALFGMTFPGNGVPVCGFRMQMIWRAAFLVLEKSPLRSAWVGSFACGVTVGCAICV